MEYDDYLAEARRAADLAGQGQYQEAAEILERLIAGDISDTDKAVMCMNLAIVYTQLENAEQALAWYARGSAYERPHGGAYVTEHWAVYLARLARYDEARAIYETLLGDAGVPERDKERLRHNVSRLQELAER